MARSLSAGSTRAPSRGGGCDPGGGRPASVTYNQKVARINDSGNWGPEHEAGLHAAWVTEPPKLNGPVQLAGYDETWPSLYAREAERISRALGDRVLLLEHIGSTSVPGLAAKPVIDILLAVADPADEDCYVPDLERAGYRLAIREPDWYQHRVLKGSDPDVNLHVLPPQSPEIGRYLGFRNHLRDNEADRRLYEQTKRQLAGRQWTYMQQYADAKTEVVEAIIARSRALGDEELPWRR
jgi:GrpB-like predicted nucleotidyltransferase (UPF0157 family)